MSTQTRCGLCSQPFPSRSEMVKHKYDFHKLVSGFLKSARRICRTCDEVCESNSQLITHKLKFHRTELFPTKSGPKLGTKFSLNHRHKLSRSLRIYYNTLDDRPLGPPALTPNSGERWCHDYSRWRTQVLRRDNHTCQRCEATRPIKLVAHHLKPYKKFPELRYDVDNGKTLCVSCHGWIEIQIRLATQFLKQLRREK